MDMGGYVVVINADKVTVTGRKSSDKLYRRHTNGRPGTMKEETFEQLQKVHTHQFVSLGLEHRLDHMTAWVDPRL